MHDIAGVSITIATILAASFFSNQSVNSLRTEMRAEINSLRNEMTGKIDNLRNEMLSIRGELLGKLDSIQKDMRDLYAEQARHDLRISNLEQNQK